MKRIVLLSGGLDSTALLFFLIDNNIKINHILFCDTGIEFPETITYITKLNKYIKSKYNLSIETIKPDDPPEYYFFDIKKRNGKRGYGVPSIPHKWCKGQLKSKLVDNWIEKNNIATAILYIGFLENENHRYKTTKKRYAQRKKQKLYVEAPFIQHKININKAERILENHFYINPIYNRYDRCSCWCCPYGGIQQFIRLYSTHPTLFHKAKLWDNKSRRKYGKGFFKDISISTLEKILNIFSGGNYDEMQLE